MRPRNLSDHIEYRAGHSIEEVARELGRDPEEFVKLASNENMFGPSPAAAKTIEESAEDAHHYPTADHQDLREALAKRWDVTSEQVWLANGGDGVIDYLHRAILEPGDEVLVPTPGFSYYGMSARYHHAEVAEYDITTMDGFALTAERVLEAYSGERIIYITSPHNPSGGRFALKDVKKIAAETEDETLIAVDEAYGEFTDAPSAVDIVHDRTDIAVLHTFSKAYGLAGLRLGYALVPTEWADAYARVNTPFAASLLACRAGLAALDDNTHVEQTIETARWSREYMTEFIEAPTYESHGNFLLVEVGEASAIAESMRERGVIIRDCSSLGLPECVRITCGTKDETKYAVRTLNEILSS